MFLYVAWNSTFSVYPCKAPYAILGTISGVCANIYEKGYEALIAEKGVNINEFLAEGSEFIQLQHGKNTITYTADTGTNYMSVSIFYRLLYLGV